MENGNTPPGLLNEDEAKHKVEQYLINRYHEFAKIKFDSSELCDLSSGQMYRFQGSIVLRSKSMLDRFVMSNTASIYRFTFEIDAVNGQILNYVFS